MHPSPFTEAPKELKRGWHTLGVVLRTLINGLFMIALVLALLALVAAFTYRMIFDPETLAAWGTNLIQSVQGFIMNLLGT